MKSTNSIIRTIADVRTNNNVLWMRLLELALEHAPADAKAALREINANDRRVSSLLAELAQ